MNESDAIEFATINNIVVTTDKIERFKIGGKWHHRIYFRVGNFIVIKFDDEKLWRIAGVTPRAFRRGDAIERCVNYSIVESQRDD
jgi:hypothetical protein